MSPTTAQRWYHRWCEASTKEQETRSCLTDRSSRPRTCPHQTEKTIEETICQLRLHARMNYRTITRYTGIPKGTIHRILRRSAILTRSSVKPPPAQRYEYPSCGDMLHIDVKKLARFHQPGHRFYDDHKIRSKRAGWEYVHVCIDDHSRLAYAEVLSNEKADTAVGFLTRATAFYHTHGIDVKRVMTDNGGCYRSHLHKNTCEDLGIKHVRTRPYRPQMNGKAERFIRTLLTQWAYNHKYTSSTQRTHHLPLYLYHYNHQRPHTALNDQPPINRTQTNQNVTTRGHPIVLVDV